MTQHVEQFDEDDLDPDDGVDLGGSLPRIQRGSPLLMQAVTQINDSAMSSVPSLWNMVPIVLSFVLTAGFGILAALSFTTHAAGFAQVVSTLAAAGSASFAITTSAAANQRRQTSGPASRQRTARSSTAA